MQMVMRVAGDRGLDQIGGPIWAVLDGEGRPRGVMGEGYPADFSVLGAFFAGWPLRAQARSSAR